MAKEHSIPITNGIGSLSISNGNYTVTGDFEGYDNSSILPTSQEITEGINSYIFTIAASGTLTLHVSDDGTEIGVPIIGATFHRCDSEGKTYGDIITTNDEGNAVFQNVPFSSEGNAPTIYFKQVSSDGEHEFSVDLQNTTLETETKTLEITNAESELRNFTVTDANYANLPIADGKITLSE